MLPEVGSIMVAPGFKIPFFSASSIIASAIRSFTEPAGFKYSSFPKIVASFTPASAEYRFSFNKGVFPIRSSALSAILLIIKSSCSQFFSVSMVFFVFL